MRGLAAAGVTLGENALAALLGAIVGCLSHQYWPQLEALLRYLTG